jgi:hypothetical protein
MGITLNLDIIQTLCLGFSRSLAILTLKLLEQKCLALVTKIEQSKPAHLHSLTVFLSVGTCSSICVFCYRNEILNNQMNRSKYKERQANFSRLKVIVTLRYLVRNAIKKVIKMIKRLVL